MNPMVSICCQTYNHERFIMKCLDGFVMQQTKFDFEILVHEDASTDRTASVLKEYELKYPNLFRCVYQTENQFLKQNSLINILFPMAKGKYIALCEGDDYWTDPLKLQKQVDFLEANMDYNYCGHKSYSRISNDLMKIPVSIESFGFSELIFRNFLNTATLLFRKPAILNLPKYFTKLPAGDWGLQLIAIKNSKAFVLPDYMSVYREHEKGLWSNLDNKEKCIQGVNIMRAFKSFYPDRNSQKLIKLAIQERMKAFGIVEEVPLAKKIINKAKKLIKKTGLRF